MLNERLFALLLKPSLFSGVAIVLASFIVIGVTNWPYFTYNAMFYTPLYGEFGAVTVLERFPSLATDADQLLGGSSVIYAAAVVLAAVIAGWVAFLIIRGVKHGVGSVKSLHSVRERHSLAETAGVRIGVMLMWAVYIFLSLNVLVPLSLFYSRVGAESLPSAEGIGLTLGSFALCLFCLHIHVIFLRLLMMRPRVFGGAAAVEQAAFYRRK